MMSQSLLQYRVTRGRIAWDAVYCKMVSRWYLRPEHFTQLSKKIFKLKKNSVLHMGKPVDYVVNEQFAINLIAEQPVSQTEDRIVSCDGGGGALGHPKVYINLDKETKTGTCGYCGLQFKQKHYH